MSRSGALSISDLEKLDLCQWYDLRDSLIERLAKKIDLKNPFEVHGWVGGWTTLINWGILERMRNGTIKEYKEMGPND